MLEALHREAQTLRTNANWGTWISSADTIIGDYQRTVAHWRREGSCPPPNLAAAHLPLAFLVWKAENGRNDHEIYWAYMHAIAQNPDVRRIDVLLELGPNPASPQGVEVRDSEMVEWNQLLVSAATPQWAFQTIEQQIAAHANASTYSLLFGLLYRFGAELPANLRQPAYDYVRSQWTQGPSNGDGESYFEVLLRVDRERARRELIGYYDASDKYRFEVVSLLDTYKGSSPAVAVAAKRWLARRAQSMDKWYVLTLKRILLFSSPETELRPTLDRIHQLLRVQREANRGDELDVLVRAVLELGNPATASELADFSTKKAIDIGTRWNILEWLVARRQPGLTQIFTVWLREDSMSRDWLRHGAAIYWGAFGTQLLAEAENINRSQTAP